MPRRIASLAVGLIVSFAPPASADDQAGLKELLRRPILAPNQALAEAQSYLESRIPRLPSFTTTQEWEKYAERLRTQILDRIVYRGEAAAWRDAPTNVEWLETIEGGPGYRIKKLRYEALPGLWIPALLYEPDDLKGEVPVILNVNGHDGNGKVAPYKQIRCINQAKRGMLALNVEWFGMGQLRSEGYAHGRMNQIDLCGTSGLAPFLLNMKRGLDVLLSLKHADPKRVAVTGLSGGGWQTIWISALDPRVTLTNPVAGYSSFLTRIRHLKDLGDSEQTPCDCATLADYTHLTALMAPRPTLLTYCVRDDCCFEAGYALPPLLTAAEPVFKLFDKSKMLRWHVNQEPGTHNYEKDNRQAHYRMLGDHFFPGDGSYRAEEIPSEKEVKSKVDLQVPLPEPNHDFHSLARMLSKKLPRDPVLPVAKDEALAWQKERRVKLRGLVQAKDYETKAVQDGKSTKGGVTTTYWRLRMGDSWTVPVVELVRGEPKSTAILVNDAGRHADPVNAELLLAAGHRVLAVDPFYFGESRLAQRDHLWALLLAAVGDRPLGVQASQVAAVARWSLSEHKTAPVKLVAVGPRSSTFVLIAAALEERAVGSVELHAAWGSLKQVIEQNRSLEQMPEMFCFGLLESFDMKQIAALVAPRAVQFRGLDEHGKTQLDGLKAFYSRQGGEINPFP